ncbi:hypothetical protein FRC05_007513 [Tulasnella sp. 425]|nr:hypothetical protein FRC05_007513 [Tulasnella sp. 425]
MVDVNVDAEAVLTFHGTNGAECEDFINRVRCHALEQGEIRDNDWPATFAESCRNSLDDTVKRDWKQLRKAPLKNPPSATAQSFPEPAPAVAPPSQAPPKFLGPLPASDPKEAEASFCGQTQKFLFKGFVKVTIPSEGSSTPDAPRSKPTSPNHSIAPSW